MKFRLQLSKTGLNRAWGWTTVGAVAVFLVLNMLDTALKSRTGFGTADLQFAADSWGFRSILDHWQVPADMGSAGFLLGLDFLFIPLYGAALFFGAVAARELLAPQPGTKRRLIDALGMAPLLAAACDAVENVLEFSMLLHGPSDLPAALAHEVSLVKYVGLLVGIVLSLTAALALLAKRRRTRKAGG